jgi:hypothetical protein
MTIAIPTITYRDWKGILEHGDIQIPSSFFSDISMIPTPAPRQNPRHRNLRHNGQNRLTDDVT